MSQKSKSIKTPEKEIAKTNSEIMKEAYETWAALEKEKRDKWREFKYRCKCPACGAVNFDNDNTKVIINIPHNDDCAYLKTGDSYFFTAEIN